MARFVITLLPIVFLVFPAGLSIAPVRADHSVRYVVTAGGPGELEIHYRAQAPSENSSGAKYDHVWVSPEAPWTETVPLGEPDRYAYVSVRQVWWNPSLRCEVWVDGLLVKHNDKGVCI
ncbi:hypothetical protein SAMN04488580_102333 [Mycobacterium sp. 283mftsu]|nr:hypothetical protein SAMN04488580_102333 [Mycobacterium sp. 283mftsu]